jgi:hypothetical protein
MKAKSKFIPVMCSLILFVPAALLPRITLAQTNYYWTTPVSSLLNGGSPQSATVDSAGNLYIADANKHVILKVAPVGTNWAVSTIAGLAGSYGSNDGTNNAARFDSPGGVAVDAADNLYVADSGNNDIREVTPSGTNWIVTTIAGAASSSSGSNDGTNGTAQFAFPLGIAVDASGNLFIGDNGNTTIRKISHSGTNWVTTTIAGTAGVGGYVDATNGDAQFAYPFGVAVDAADNVYVADAVNEIIRKVTPSGTNWIVTTIAGQVGSPGGNDGTNLDAQFNFPTGINVDTAGNVYVSDTFNDSIRRLTPSGTNWIVTTIGGSAGSAGLADGTNDVAQFSAPQGVAVDGEGNVYVGDTGNNALRLGFLFPPSLQVALITNQITLFYPAGLGTNFNFILQSTTDLANNDWAVVTNQWQLDDNGTPYISLVRSNDVPDEFFRLELPSSP